MPALVHVGEKASDRTRVPAAPVSSDELDRRLQDMLPQLPDLDLPPPK